MTVASEYASERPKVTLTMVGDGKCRISFGDAHGGRYVIVDYSEVRDYVLGLKPRAELVTLYGLELER